MNSTVCNEPVPVLTDAERTPSLLVIDDAEEMRLVLEAMLDQAGYPFVQTVESFEAARPFLERRDDEGRCPYDLILLDLMMPGVDGIEACRWIRADRALDDTPIIVITAKTGSHDLEQAFQAGAMDFIRKPIDRVELLARIRSALRYKHQLDTVKDHERTLVELASRLQEANETLERLSTLDGLTGIANRRAFDVALHRELRRAARKSQPISLILMDIDYFKAYNDHYGHLQGDACLVQVAQAIAGFANRPGDIAARYGGEEFALLLPDTAQDSAYRLAERVRAAVAALGLPHERSACAAHVTLSLGVACMTPIPGTMPGDLIAAADRALYSAKETGRNRSMPLPPA